jgi:hypothetical protein
MSRKAYRLLGLFGWLNLAAALTIMLVTEEDVLMQRTFLNSALVLLLMAGFLSVAIQNWFDPLALVPSQSRLAPPPEALGMHRSFARIAPIFFFFVFAMLLVELVASLFVQF